MDINTFLKQLKQYGLENEVPNISEDNAAYLLDLVSSIQAKEVLEIGTANGYSTIHFANCIKDWGGSITTIEFSTLSHEAAKKNFEKVGLLNITPLLGNALDILPTLPSKYDFIFIDGMKRRSKDFLALCIPKVKKGGIIVIDDVIKFKEKMVGLYEFLEAEKITFELVQVDVDDGIMIIKESHIPHDLFTV